MQGTTFGSVFSGADEPESSGGGVLGAIGEIAPASADGGEAGGTGPASSGEAIPASFSTPSTTDPSDLNIPLTLGDSDSNTEAANTSELTSSAPDPETSVGEPETTLTETSEASTEPQTLQRELDSTPSSAFSLATAPDSSDSNSTSNTTLNPCAQVRFEQNVGQFRSGVHFVARAGQATYQISTTELVANLPTLQSDSTSTDPAQIRISFLGANAEAQVFGQDLLATRTNYIAVDDPSQWFSYVANFGQVYLEEVYTGIDSVLWHPGWAPRVRLGCCARC